MKENEIKNIKINKITDFLWEIQPFGGMRAPCRIYATEKMLANMLRDRTVIQGMNVAALPGIQKYSLIMPDGHEGYGFPIGGVAALDLNEGGISPGGIGYDINCGIRLLKCGLSRDEITSKISGLLDKTFKYCPAGLGSSNFNIKDKDMDRILKNGAGWAVENGFGVMDDLTYCEELGAMDAADPKKVGETARKRGHGQMATLGSGNHFLEIQYIDEIFDADAAKAFGIEAGQVTFMIHCGSRALGHQVCSDYIRLMEKNFPEILNKLPDRELIYAPAKSSMAEDYYGAMCAAANFAWCNRHMLAHQLRIAVNELFGETRIETIYDIAHNIAKIEQHLINGRSKSVWVHRKGATRAFGPNDPGIPEKYKKTGQPVIIPGSMGTASYLLAGTGTSGSETFASAAHGAGRTMSRHEAVKNFKGEMVAADLKRAGITVKGASMKGIAEEAGAAYKPIEEVISVSHNAGIGRLVARLRPIGVIKG